MGSERKRFCKSKGYDLTTKKLSLPNGEMVDEFVQAIQEAMETCDERMKTPYGDILAGVKRMEFEESDRMFPKQAFVQSREVSAKWSLFGIVKG